MTPVNDAWARLLAQEHARAALALEAFAFNKPMLFGALERAGIRLVVATFDGAGDSGQIESIDAYDEANTELPLPSEVVGVLALADDLSGVTAETCTPREMIEAMVYDHLASTHGGWENDDGAWGEFRFDVAERAIMLEYNERRMESDYYEHVF